MLRNMLTVYFFFHLFRHEGESKYPSVSGTYLLKLQQPGVLYVVKRNRHITETCSDIVDDASVNLCKNTRSTRWVVLQDEYQEQSLGPTVIPDEELNLKIRILNQKQRDVFDIVHNWSKRSVKNLLSILQSAIDPLYIFLTGNAGCDITKILY